ncbi:flagellar motor protein MotB [Clostridium sp. C8-1-8]|uniref:flagellar motor protein MotB n=1 Tax=Clostridium sp. C8-1-8 TaxID=2698831 RepID=UPI00136E6379|nr:flagellar motor protein MotB [Clostridium sp. C8-1-8]
MKKKRPEKENNERWLLTYSDLITLLMIFFVVMYASSTVDAKKYSQIANSLSIAMGGGKNIIGTSDSASVESSKTLIDAQQVQQAEEKAAEEKKEKEEQQKLENVKKEVDKMIEGSDLKGSISTSLQERGLVISFNDTVFFDSGKADVKGDNQKKLISLAGILNKIDNFIRVEGHTDNVPINTAYFHSNWQLSSVRAANVVEFLVNNGGIAAKRLSSVGYGEYRPVAANDSEQGRSKNRRVDILLLNNTLNASENKN